MGQEANRAVAICRDCDSVQSVRVFPDGSIRPINTGLGENCQCGSTDFELLTDDPDVQAYGDGDAVSDDE